MGFGLTLSASSSTILQHACVCVCLMFAVTTARPSDSLEASDWPMEWQQVADLWVPKADKDKWRAFEPAKEISATRWWEDKMDDDLWDQKAHETSTDQHENKQSTKAQVITTAEPTPEGERQVANTSQTEVNAEISTTATTTINRFESGFGQPIFKKGEVNTFVEPDPGTYYRSSGENYGDKIWDPVYSEFSQSKDSSSESETYHVPPAIKASSKQEKDKNLSVMQTSSLSRDSHLDTESHTLEESKEQGTSQSSKKIITNKSADKDNSLDYKESSKEGTTAADASNVSRTVQENVNSALSENEAPLVIESLGKVLASSSYEVNVSNTFTDDSQDKNILIASVDAPVTKSQVKPVVAVVEQKSSESVLTDANAIYGKGERLAIPRIGSMNLEVKDKMVTETSRNPEEVTTRKPNNEFVDWDNWDNSAFDYYDDTDNSNESNLEENKDKKRQGVVSSTEASHVQSDDQNEDISDDDDDDDDYYGSVDDNDDDDDGEDNDDDDAEYDDESDLAEDDNQHEIVTEKHVETTVLPVNVKNNQTKQVTWSVKSVKGFDLNVVDKQSDEAANHADHSHENEEIIYDSHFPNHKPSVKKDLTNPANNKKQEEISGSSQSQSPLTPKNVELQNVSVKKGFSVSDFQPVLLNTKSNALTSPNPTPPGLGGNKEHFETLAQRTTPSSSSNDINMALANLSKQRSEVNKGFILSFPLEFCKVDSECRAGRTCVIGVCRCFTPGMCTGHHKPVCGSDGFQYPSHCELHRVACVNRIHIRADRRGKCFQKEIEEKEKSWLLDQEKLLQEMKEKQSAHADKNVQISSHEAMQFRQDVTKGLVVSDVKNVNASANEKANVITEKPTSVSVTNGKKECTWKEMGEFKEALLMFYCQKFAEPNCKLEVKTDREYLSMLMFSYCDRDYDYYLTAKELDDKERDEHFTKNIILNCHLHDFIKYADNLEADGKLTVSEFTSSFEAPIPSTPPHIQIEMIPTLASAGNGLELKCGIDAENVIWRRHGAQLSDDKRSHQLMVFDDGALFFSTVGLHHIGNYTCMDANDESKAQIHRLKVQTLPVIEVMPIVQTHVTGSDIELKCHAEGVPKPVITWKQGREVLQNSPHSTLYYGGGHIVIHNAQFDTDTGTYTCSAHSQAGTSEKSVSVHVLPPSASSSKESTKEVGTFVVFHSKGISAYDPLRCLLRHQVPANFGNFKFIPDALDGPLTLCRKGENCQWGEAVKVGTEFIYVCQPDQNRIMVMNAGDSWNPLQIIDTDKRPEKVWYVKHLDQVWVLCGNQEHAEGSKTVVVIRDASQHIQHRSVHTQPVGNHFDMVQDLFIAPSNDLEHEFAYGYVSHRGQNGLFKLSLEDMSYTKAIDLTNYGCVPTNIAFVPIGGHVVIQCVSAADQHTLQLVMDYLTDTITSTTSLNGRPMSSPDSRHLVTVDQFTGKVIATSVSDEGVLETTYEVTVSASISDVAFMPAMSHQGYDLVLTSADDDDVIIMNLVTGKVEKIPGSQYSDPKNSWHPSPIHRHIISGNTMSNYLMAPSRSSLTILDAKFKQVECEFEESADSNVMIYIPSSYTS